MGLLEAQRAVSDVGSSAYTSMHQEADDKTTTLMNISEAASKFSITRVVRLSRLTAH